MAKPHINKTSRVRFKDRYSSDVITIYCSSVVTREVSEHCMRLANNVLVPLRGHNDALVTRLKELTKSDPKHFTTHALQHLT